jgi:hypothetical protein
MENSMPFVYRGFITLAGKPKVDGGECARLVQHYLPHIGHTSTWKPGERVLDVLMRGNKIEPGTAVATFVKGRYPHAGHRHAAFFKGVVTACSYDPKLKACPVMGFVLIDQWNPKPGDQPRPDIRRRTVNPQGKMMSDGNFPRVSDNAEAFYIIER